MIIDRKFQIWKCVTSDRGRPALAHVDIQPNPGSSPDPAGFVDGTAAATNGFVLAVVPVQLYLPPETQDLVPPDVPGLLAPDVFTAALKVARKNRVDELIINLGKPDLAGLVDGSWLPRYTDPDLGDSNYPDWAPIVPKRQKPDEREWHLMALSLQPSFLVRVCQAIGCQTAVNGRGSGTGSGLSRMVTGSPNQAGRTSEPIIVEPESANFEETFVPPFGLVMPMHFGEDTDGYYSQ